MSCNRSEGPPEQQPAPELPEQACPAFLESKQLLPGVDPKHLTLEFWLERTAGYANLDQVLLEPGAIETLNASLQLPRADYHPTRDLLAPISHAQLTRELKERRQWAQAKLSKGEYVDQQGAAFDQLTVSLATQEAPLGEVTELKVALSDVVLRCAPVPDGFYGPALDLRLDHNACSVLRAQEPVRVLAEWPNGMKLVEAAFALGWLPAGTALSAPVPEELQQRFVRGPWREIVGSTLDVATGPDSASLPIGTRLPTADPIRGSAYVATARGVVETAAQSEAQLRRTRRALTRRGLLEQAFRHVGQPYGLGDTHGGRDCSRLLLDVLRSFDMQLPRHSSWQSQAGSFWIDVQAVRESERALLFDAAARRGSVLLHFPGHIMLYLGRNEAGVPMVLHALGEYVEPCAGKQTQAAVGDEPRETVVRVKNIGVSTLELGRGTSRKALIERITRVTVLGGTPGSELAGVATVRPAAPASIPANAVCKDSQDKALYALPERPNVQQPLRVVAAMNGDPGPAALTLIDPDGHAFRPEVVRLGGPPFGQVATVASPKQGSWKAVFADGDQVLACQRIFVEGWRPREGKPDPGPIWRPTYQWHTGNENLYALFVERLFDGQPEDRTWPNLHSLLRDEEHNLLFDYRGWQEESDLQLVPDCADLPYALRAYFAWKLRLPFGFRRCTRGRLGKPPSCEEPGAADNLMSRLELPGKGGRMLPRSDVEAFGLFVNTQLKSNVHSSSGRTLPKDDLTDLYPVPLSREALKPGTVFADPYGHFLVIADWRAQGLDGYGLLMGADAQPDGTIGQRRFWRGTFLFDPDTESGGAGFKAFRPRSFVAEPVSVELELDASAEANARLLAPVASAAAKDKKRPREHSGAPAPTSQSVKSQNQWPLLLGAQATESEVTQRLDGAGVWPASGSSTKDTTEGATTKFSVERIGYYKEATNQSLRRAQRFSLQQYESSGDDFYATVEAMINPRPLDAEAMQSALIDALFEAVSRRLLSVDNGEAWVREHPGETIEMPQGDSIFLTEGPWEDFSTPSRDLRLLISIDTVTGFPARVRLAPERFGLQSDAVDAAAHELEARLPKLLAERRLSYTRSDGVAQHLTLQQVVERAPAFELAYNPNDCVEVRWGAPEGSAEMASCQRHAPAGQREAMLQYRDWFATRKRPPQ